MAFQSPRVPTHNTTDHLAILNNNANCHILMALLFYVSHNSEFSIILNEETEALSVECHEFQALRTELRARQCSVLVQVRCILASITETLMLQFFLCNRENRLMTSQYCGWRQSRPSPSDPHRQSFFVPFVTGCYGFR